MPEYFDFKNLQVDRFPVNTQRHVELGVEWRRLNSVNLEWVKTALEKGIEKPEADNDRLGMAVLFYSRLRAILEPKEYSRDDLHDDLFGEWKGEF